MPHIEWPFQHEADHFYGNPRGRYGSHVNPQWVSKNIVYVTPPYPMRMGNVKITRIPIHRLCSESLVRVLKSLLKHYNDVANEVDGDHTQEDVFDLMREDGVTEFDGSFVYRSMRAGSHLSMHAYGCAIDFDAAHNAFGSHHHRFKSDSPIVQCFEAEDWRWGGKWRHPDAMHFQAAIVG